MFDSGTHFSKTKPTQEVFGIFPKRSQIGTTEDEKETEKATRRHSAFLRAFTPVFDGLWPRVNAPYCIRDTAAMRNAWAVAFKIHRRNAKGPAARRSRRRGPGDMHAGAPHPPS